MTKIVFGLIAAAAGAATAFQAAANAGLSSRIGLGAALVVNTVIVLIASLIFYLARGQFGSIFPSGTPWILYLGGVCGFLIILSLAFVFPRVGAAVAIALVVLGQGIGALAIDHYGLLGMPREPLTLFRVAGLLLVGGGIVLIRA
jgi:transporter family-2 protein